MELLRTTSKALDATDESSEARRVLIAVKGEILDHRPVCLADVSAGLDGPYVILRFVHQDGTVLEIGHGDGYTWLVSEPVDYHGWLDPTDLTAVIRGALGGRLTYISCTRLGYKVRDYFRVPERDGEDLGRGFIAGVPGMLLRWCRCQA